MQLLAAIWMDIVDLRAVKAKLRHTDKIGKQVVTKERQAEARTVTEPLKDQFIIDKDLLALQLEVERAWQDCQNSLDLSQSLTTFCTDLSLTTFYTNPYINW